MTTTGTDVALLSDAELEAQGTRAHATRNWVFLHGTAEQYRNHTERMLALEEEYLRRFPKRTWQGTSSEPAEVDEVTRLRIALRGIARQVAVLLDDSEAGAQRVRAAGADVRPLLRLISDAGGRLHKLEVHQRAREAGIEPAELAALYRGDRPLLRTEREDRVLTAAALELLQEA